MRASAGLLALLALALLPATAPAKEIARAEVCGADGCHAVAGNGAAGHADDRFLLTSYGPDQRRPTSVGAYYLLRVQMRMGGEARTIVTRWFPGDELVEWDDPAAPGTTVWSRPGGDALAMLRRATRGVPALPARSVPASVLDGVMRRSASEAHESGAPPWSFALGAGLLLAATAGLLGRRRRRHRGTRAVPAPGR